MCYNINFVNKNSRMHLVGRRKNLHRPRYSYTICLNGGKTHLEKFTETDDNCTVVDRLVLVVGISLFRIVRAHIVYDGAQFQDLTANVRLCLASPQIRLRASYRPTEHNINMIRLKHTEPDGKLYYEKKI